MAKDRLDGRFPHAAANHFRGESVSEGMGCDLALDAELLAQLRDDVLDRARADRRAGFSEFIPSTERRESARAAHSVAPHTPIRRNGVSRFDVEVDGAALAAFCPIDVCGSVDQIDVASAQGTELRNAHTGPEEEQDHPSYLETPQFLLG